MKTPTLNQTIRSLQTLFTTEAGAPTPTAAQIKSKAETLQFPDPALAEQVFTFMQQKRVQFSTVTPAEISDAFLALLMDSEAAETLSLSTKNNPWLHIRSLLRQSGSHVGGSLMDLYKEVKDNGLGYSPTLPNLHQELKELDKTLTLTLPMSSNALNELAKSLGLPDWKLSLLAAWQHKKKIKTRGVSIESVEDSIDENTDENTLEQFFSDPDMLTELSLLSPQGPWGIYEAQARALRSLRYFSQGLLDIEEALNKK